MGWVNFHFHFCMQEKKIFYEVLLVKEFCIAFFLSAAPKMRKM